MQTYQKNLAFTNLATHVESLSRLINPSHSDDVYLLLWEIGSNILKHALHPSMPCSTRNSTRTFHAATTYPINHSSHTQQGVTNTAMLCLLASMPFCSTCLNDDANCNASYKAMPHATSNALSPPLKPPYLSHSHTLLLPPLFFTQKYSMPARLITLLHANSLIIYARYITVSCATSAYITTPTHSLASPTSALAITYYYRIYPYFYAHPPASSISKHKPLCLHALSPIPLRMPLNTLACITSPLATTHMDKSLLHSPLNPYAQSHLGHHVIAHYARIFCYNAPLFYILTPFHRAIELHIKGSYLAS